MSPGLSSDIRRSAWVSDCGRYRYVLTRRWSDGSCVTFVMLNPSYADAERDDLTVTKCIGFARAWGHGSMRVVNLYGLISTDPAGLWTVEDPIGPENESVLRRVATTSSGLLVAAWGMNAPAERVAQVLEIPGMDRLQSLGVTASGAPRHPSRLAYATPLADWPVVA